MGGKHLGVDLVANRCFCLLHLRCCLLLSRWIGAAVGILVGYIFLFNIIVIVALKVLSGAPC